MYSLKFSSKGAPKFWQGCMGGNPPPTTPIIAGSATEKKIRLLYDGDDRKSVK